MDGQLNDLVGEWFSINHRDKICVSSLDPERVTIDRFGNPSNEYPVIKIGGTNGKESTTRFVGWSLIEEGYNVGIMSNPSATTNPTEIIQVNHTPIERDVLRDYCEDVFEVSPSDIESYGIRTIAAFQYFADRDVDIVVLEAGVGGKTDATNLSTAEVTAITNVGNDHIESLGGSSESVQSHIAGLADRDKPAVTNAAREKTTELYTTLRNQCLSVIRSNPHAYLFRQKDSLRYRASISYDGVVREIETPFIARYQQRNIDTALTVLTELDLSVSASSVFKTIEEFNFAARSELVEHQGVTFILDGAHNMAGINSLESSLSETSSDVIFVFTALSDKPWEKMVDKLSTVGEVIITRPQGTSRTDHESQLRSTQHKYIKDVDEAIKTSLEIAESSDSVVCVTGSLYLMRTVRPILNLTV